MDTSTYYAAASTLLTICITAGLVYMHSRSARTAAKNKTVALPGNISAPVDAIILPEAKMIDGAMFPLALVPKDANAGAAERIAFVRAHHIELLALVRQYGAVLLRGWGSCSPEHFSEISLSLDLKTTDMACSAGPRFPVAKNVFTANEAPPSERIPFHHEMAQCDAPPSVVMFFCETPATCGGATPIIKSHLAATFLRERYPAVAERLAAKGVRYIRIMPPVTDPSSALGKSWKHSLRVESEEAAEDALIALGSKWTWLGDGMLRTETKPMPAMLMDERTGREVFFTAAESTFNSIEDEQDHGTSDDPTAAGTAMEKKVIRPVKAIIYGDGSPLDAETRTALHEVSAFMLHEQVAVPWQSGDALILDNATVQHARQAFTPPRRILASLVGQLSKREGKLRESESIEEMCKRRTAFVLPKEMSVSPSSTMDGLPKHDVPHFSLSVTL